MRYWVISPNAMNDGRTDHFLARIREEQVVLMGWDADHDLGRMFAEDVQLGDLVIIAQGANRNKRSYFAGLVASGPLPDKEGEVTQCRKLERFVDLTQRDIPFDENCAWGGSNQIRSIYELKPENPQDMEVMRTVMRIINEEASEARFDSYCRLLAHHRQMILTGAPGTGKTYAAKAVARRMLPGTGKQPRSVTPGNDDSELRICFVQFHPSFDYPDFVEGLKPRGGSNGQIGFELRNGIFKAFCRRAGVIERILFKRPQTQPLSVTDLDACTADHLERYLGNDVQAIHFWQQWIAQARASGNADLPPFCFIIDEINRGDLSRIFGELFYALEPDYRGANGAVCTQYAQLNHAATFFVDEHDDRFFIPSNLLIVGTMNDIDRSVESFDFALRRRFVWVEMNADEALFAAIASGLGEHFEEASKRYNALNAAIGLTPGLGNSYKIGPAYFLKLNAYVGEQDLWDQLWQNHLKFLLQEYVRGMADAQERMDALRAAYDLKSAPGLP